MTTAEELTREIRKHLDYVFCVDSDTPTSARDVSEIVEVLTLLLGITPEMVEAMRCEYNFCPSVECRQHSDDARDAIVTLLEVAGVQTEVNDG